MSDLPKMNLQFEYPVLDQQTRDDGVRHYGTPDGQSLPSVTTILSATADKAFLKLWEARIGTKKANQIRDEAAALGTLVHKHLECHLESQERPRGNNHLRVLSRRMADVVIERGIIHIDEIWGIESPLYFPGLYAGTSDLIGVYKGEPAIIDFKNARKMRTADMIGDYRKQLCAYGLAHNELFGTKIKRGVILMIARDLSFQSFVMDGDEFEEEADGFLERVSTYYAG